MWEWGRLFFFFFIFCLTNANVKNPRNTFFRPVSNMYIVAEGELVFLDEEDEELSTGVLRSGTSL